DEESVYPRTPGPWLAATSAVFLAVERASGRHFRVVRARTGQMHPRRQSLGNQKKGHPALAAAVRSDPVHCRAHHFFDAGCHPVAVDRSAAAYLEGLSTVGCSVSDSALWLTCVTAAGGSRRGVLWVVCGCWECQMFLRWWMYELVGWRGEGCAGVPVRPGSVGGAGAHPAVACGGGAVRVELGPGGGPGAVCGGGDVVFGRGPAPAVECGEEG